MSHYCGIDLHSNNYVVVVIDDEGNRVFDKRLGNDLLYLLPRMSQLFSDDLAQSFFQWIGLLLKVVSQSIIYPGLIISTSCRKHLVLEVFDDVTI